MISIIAAAASFYLDVILSRSSGVPPNILTSSSKVIPVERSGGVVEAAVGRSERETERTSPSQ